jgi:hypothetical protein
MIVIVSMPVIVRVAVVAISLRVDRELRGRYAGAQHAIGVDVHAWQREGAQGPLQIA